MRTTLYIILAVLTALFIFSITGCSIRENGSPISCDQ
jgi:hypothetical protein